MKSEFFQMIITSLLYEIETMVHKFSQIRVAIPWTLIVFSNYPQFFVLKNFDFV